MKRKAITLLLTAAILLTACSESTVYDTFQHVDNMGWEKNDILTYSIPEIPSEGEYALSLSLRIGNEYPFQNLQMIVSQEIFPSILTTTDVVTFTITDKLGKKAGDGVTLYQYSLPVRTTHYSTHDSISVRVRHDMKREILPGIMDVGITLKKTGDTSDKASR